MDTLATSSSPEQALLSFLKALADANRLRIVGLLAHRAYAVEELATVLDLRVSTVSHHLAKLTAAGLVAAQTEGHYHMYALQLSALHGYAKTLAKDESLRALAPSAGTEDPFAAKVLAAFTDQDGRLVRIPAKRKKFEVILRHALALFPETGPWDEREVNRRLKTFTDDVASLRRGFIDHRLMTREPGGSGYRKLIDGPKKNA